MLCQAADSGACVRAPTCRLAALCAPRAGSGEDGWL